MDTIPRTPPITDPPIRLAVCVSGGGTTLQNLIEQIRARRLWAQIVQVVASRPRIGAIPRAEAAGIPLALASRTAQSSAEFSASIFDPIRRSKADLVILGGFLALVKIPPDYKGRVINVHPALIPAFCGKGYYGGKVHQAVLDAGVKVSGCTVHFADDTYDNGPDHPPADGPGPRGRHGRDPGRPGLQRRVPGAPGGDRPLCRRPAPARGPPREDPAGDVDRVRPPAQSKS